MAPNSTFYYQETVVQIWTTYHGHWIQLASVFVCPSTFKFIFWLLQQFVDYINHGRNLAPTTSPGSPMNLNAQAIVAFPNLSSDLMKHQILEKWDILSHLSFLLVRIGSFPLLGQSGWGGWNNIPLGRFVMLVATVWTLAIPAATYPWLKQGN